VRPLALVARTELSRRPLRAPDRVAAHLYRRATSGARVLPGALIIGAQKAGTTSLFNFLTRHPGVVGPASGIKELHFFDSSVREEAGYRSHFPTAVEVGRVRGRLGFEPAVMEGTPYYLAHPCVPGRVKDLLPGAKLIACLREPIARAISHHRHNMRKGHDAIGSFAEAVRAEPERLAGLEGKLLSGELSSSYAHRNYSYLERGKYADQLSRWFDAFGAERVRVVIAEEMFADPGGTVRDLAGFLGIGEADLGSFPESGRDPGAAASKGIEDSALRAELEGYFAEPNERLAAMLGRDLPW